MGNNRQPASSAAQWGLTMGGIIMGALGGMGDALQNIGGSMFKAELDRDAPGRRTPTWRWLAQSRWRSSSPAWASVTKQMVERIDTAAKGIIGGKIAQKPTQSVRTSSEPDRRRTWRTRKSRRWRSPTVRSGGGAHPGNHQHRLHQPEGCGRPSSATSAGWTPPEHATAQRETAAAMRDETQRYIAELRETTAQQRIGP